ESLLRSSNGGQQPYRARPGVRRRWIGGRTEEIGQCDLGGRCSERDSESACLRAILQRRLESRNCGGHQRPGEEALRACSTAGYPGTLERAGKAATAMPRSFGTRRPTRHLRSERSEYYGSSDASL